MLSKFISRDKLGDCMQSHGYVDAIIVNVSSSARAVWQWQSTVTMQCFSRHQRHERRCKCMRRRLVFEDKLSKR